MWLMWLDGKLRWQTCCVMDCGGKRSATPLWPAATVSIHRSVPPSQSAVVASLCRRSPKSPVRPLTPHPLLIAPCIAGGAKGRKED